jgi:hypothetical protein
VPVASAWRSALRALEVTSGLFTLLAASPLAHAPSPRAESYVT